MEIGSQLNNRYTLTARLGRGAMGLVYRGVDAKTGQEVALKIIARDLAFDSEMLERFRREGEALHQLRHPNIVGFVEMFALEGQQVIVMECVPGGSLHELIKTGPLPAERARRIALEIGDALTRAHHIGIIHRDLKPENVLLTEDGTPKLGDFGVARLVSEGTRLTGTGTQVGTPFYMSPEAWEGKPLDGQTDIWSLGVVFYEMLAGKVPFGGDTVVAVMNQVLNAPLPDLRSLRPDAPVGLTRIIARMLCRDKAKRYQTMREVAADIERGDIAGAAPPLAPRAAPRPTPPAPTAFSPSEARTALAQPRPSRLRRLGWTLARLGVTALLGLAVIGCIIVIGGSAVLGNILEGVVASIPFYPNEIGPGETYTFSRPAVEAQLNQQTTLALPGTLSDLHLTFVPSDTLRVTGRVFGADTTLTFRAEVANRLPRVSLVSYDSLPLPLVGDLLAGGVNRGLAKIFAQNKLEMVSMVFNADELTLVLNGPGVEKSLQSTCVSNKTFRDDFSAVTGAWNPFETALAKASYDQGAYVLRAIAPHTVLAQYLSGCSFGDVQVTVDATNPRQGSYIEYGLIFNRKDAQNYFAFLVNTTGFYALQKVEGGVHTMLGDGWTAAPPLHTDTSVNHLGLRVEGMHVSPSLNGQALLDYNVDMVSYGGLGLYVGSSDGSDVQVRFDNFAALMLSEATPFPTLVVPPAPTSLVSGTLLATAASPNLSPTEQGLTVGQCDAGDLCRVDNLGRQQPLGLNNDYGNFEDSFSWSPDGQQIAFAACRKSEMNRPATCRDLYTVDRNGDKVTEVYRNPLTGVGALSWSPDGAWIAFVEDGQLVLIRPTGMDHQVLDAITPAVRPAWSPDSQHVAWVSKSSDGNSTLVWTIDLNGKNRKLLFLDANQPIQRGQVLITWSPDGTKVVFADEKGQAWTIQANCTPATNRGCDGTSRTQIKEVPMHWLSDFYPQWAGEKVSR